MQEPGWATRSILDELQYVDAPTFPSDPLGRLKQDVISRIREQIRYAIDPRAEVEKGKRRSPRWFDVGDGDNATIWLRIKRRRVDVRPGKTIMVGSSENIPRAFELLIAAIENGELDAIFEENLNKVQADKRTSRQL